MRRLSVALAILLIATPAYFPRGASAQFTIPGATSALLISSSPRYPAPDSSVTLTLQSSLYNLNTSDIVWIVNGKQSAQGTGLKTLALQTGSAGSRIDVVVDISGASGAASASATIIPTSVDLLWESDSYVPPFYQGRALASAGSSVRVVAIPNFSRPGSAPMAPGKIVFTWTKDGEVMESLSGLGRSTITLDGPMLFGTETISVEATASDGSVSGQGVLRIPDTEPQLALYEDHPLFGTLYHRALGTTTFVPSNEMSFVAVPYFAAVTTATTRSLEYAWRVNGSPVAADTVYSNEITINAASSTGATALIDLSLTHATNYFMSAEHSWRVTFNARSAGVSGVDPFRQ